MFKQNLQTQVEYETLPLTDFRHGLNTNVAADRIAPTEASKLINWKIRKGGGLVSRPPIIKYSATATTNNAAVKTCEEVNIGGTTYTLLVDANDILYYLNEDLEATTIGTLEGATTIMSYNGVALLFDGSYIKYLDGVTSIKICYDGGTGTSGYMVDDTALTQDAFLAVGNGTNTKAAKKFTTPAWDSGYTIPITTIGVYLDKAGSPSGSVSAVLRNSTTGAAMATKTLCSCSDITEGTPALFTATFLAADVTTEMSPSTAYYASIEYAGGDGANYVKLVCYNIGSGGDSYYNDGAWKADATKDVVLKVGPGRPPKGKFGEIWNKRPFVAGDPDNPGYVWYGNLTHLDWSTTDGGGYIGMIDSDNDNFEVGGLKAFYGNLYVFGTQSQPYLSTISGGSPSEYVQSLTFQRPWCTHLTLTDAVNDIWYFTNEGAVPISGVQEYGDLRAQAETDPVSDRFDNYWGSSTAVAGYYPVDGQVWLVMDYHRVVVIHTKHPTQDPSGSGVRYPRAEYELYQHNLSNSDNGKWTASGSGTNEYYYTDTDGNDPGFDAQPDYITINGVVSSEGTAGSLTDHQWDYGDNDTLGFNTVYVRDESGDPDTTSVCIRTILKPQCFGKSGNYFLIGASDGFLYRVDATDYKDMSTIQLLPILRTAYMELPFTHANFNEVQIATSIKGGGSINMDFYTNGIYGTTTASTTIALAVRDNLTVDEAIMDVEDALFLVDPELAAPLFQYINFNGRSVMVEVNGITMAGYPIYNNGILLKYRRLSY